MWKAASDYSWEFPCWEHCVTPGSTAHKTVGAFLSLGPLELLPQTFNSVYTELLVVCQLQLWVSSPGTGPRGGCFWVSALLNCDFLYLAVDLSKCGSSNLLCYFSSLMDPRKVIHFPFVQFFCCCWLLLLLYGWEWQLPSSLTGRPETRNCSFLPFKQKYEGDLWRCPEW